MYMYSRMDQSTEIVYTICTRASRLLLQRRRIDEVVGLEAFRVAHDLVQACTLDRVADLLEVRGRELDACSLDVLLDALSSAVRPVYTHHP